MQQLNFDKDFPFIIFDYQIPHELKCLHLHDCMEIGLIKSGEGIFIIENKKYTFQKDSIILINKLEAHRAKSISRDRAHGIYIYIHSSFIDKISLISPRLNCCKLLALCGENFDNILYNLYIQQCIEEIWCIFYSNFQLKNELLMSMIMKLLILISIHFQEILSFEYNQHKMIDDNQFSLLQTLDFINKNFMRKIYIHELAELCNLSESHFRKKFRETIGKTPGEYIISRRLKNAYILIYHQGLSASEAAYVSGFHNYSNFSKLFEKEFGLRPKQLKN